MSDARRLPDQRMIPQLHARSWFEPCVETPPEPVPSEPEDDVWIRPFMVTSGRTDPRCELRVDTLIRASPTALSEPLRFESRKIVELCRDPRSVAEIAAALGVPLGVARVLIADLINGSIVSFQKATELSTHAIERIRDLVRAL